MDRTHHLQVIWATAMGLSIFISLYATGLTQQLLRGYALLCLVPTLIYTMGTEKKSSKAVSQSLEVIAPVAAPPMPNNYAQSSLKFFNWDDLRNIDLFPSLAIMGKPGTGKTVLAEWLLYLLQGESRVITTKRKSSQWRGLPVFGVPRDFEAISSALGNLVTELGDRIANLDFDHVALNVAIDELPAIALNIPTLKDYLQPLILEARETKIRPIFLMHGDEVELLGIQGKGSLRKSITYIRLGNFALEYAQELVNKKRADVSLIDWLEQQSRPCLVDNCPAIIPDLSNWQPNSNSIQPELPESSLNRLNQLLELEFQYPNSNSIQPESGLNDADLRTRIAELKSAGLNQNQIILAIWQAKAGGNKAYQNALAEYRRLTS